MSNVILQTVKSPWTAEAKALGKRMAAKAVQKANAGRKYRFRRRTLYKAEKCTLCSTKYGTVCLALSNHLIIYSTYVQGIVYQLHVQDLARNNSKFGYPRAELPLVSLVFWSPSDFVFRSILSV